MTIVFLRVSSKYPEKQLDFHQSLIVSDKASLENVVFCFVFEQENREPTNKAIIFFIFLF
jgi:hypothetical protein